MFSRRFNFDVNVTPKSSQQKILTLKITSHIPSHDNFKTSYEKKNKKKTVV